MENGEIPYRSWLESPAVTSFFKPFTAFPVYIQDTAYLSVLFLLSNEVMPNRVA